jgi:carbonic anhydrase
MLWTKWLVVCAVGGACQAVWAQSPTLPDIFTRKSTRQSDTVPREQSFARAKAAAEMESRSAENAAQDVAVKMATPSNAEAVLRSALASVSTGRTQIVIRTREWDGEEKPAAREGESGGAKNASGQRRAAVPDERSWGYGTDNGPQRWSKIDPAFRLCSQGKSQSPIDIWSDLADVASESSKIFSYSNIGVRRAKAVAGQLRVRALAGSALTYQGVGYFLESIEFRLPGEGRVDGVAPVMSVYLRHRSSEGKLAMVSVPVKVLGNVRANPAMETLLSLATTEGRAGEQIDANQLLPASRGYYYYQGSLTQPPCSEGVHWFVMHDPITISRAQYARFAEVNPPNARPSQRLAGRSVVSFEP